MNVFIPHHKLTNNIYLDEIIACSNCNFIFGSYLEYDESYEIVNIQFPEAIFDWMEPSQLELKELESKIHLWKKKSKIVYTMNDLENHYDEKSKFLDLFQLIHRYADGVIHLGNYSLHNYKCLFSEDCKHITIHHPLYNSLLNKKEGGSALFQEAFGVDLKNKYVVSVIGNIRSKEEVRLILKAFKKIPVKNKFLVVPNMMPVMDVSKCRPYRFRKIYKKIFEKIFYFSLNRRQYFFDHKFLEYDYLIDLIKHSSLILIPRIRNLNSGNLYLGLTFNKPMLIPKIGNLTEVAEYFEFPVLDLKKKNFDQVFSRITSNKFNDVFSSTEYLKKKELFSPQNISQAYRNFFEILISL